MRLSDFGKTIVTPVMPAAVPLAPTASGSSPSQAPSAKALAPGVRTGRSPREAYGRAIEAARLLARGEADKQGTRGAVAAAARDLALGMDEDPFALLELAGRSTAGNYLYAHAANTAIYAARVARGLKWDFERQCATVEAALWHDAALALHLGLCRLGRVIPTDAYSESVLHPLESGEHIRSIPEATAAFREKLPWLTGRDAWHGAEESSRIIGFCALYESITHWRPWRAAFLPSDGVKMMTKGHGHAPCDALARPFLSQMGLYPVGSWVRLSNRDVGVVTKAHAGLVLNPELDVLMGSDGVLKASPVHIDLKKNPMIRVLEPVDPFQVFRPHAPLLTRLQLSRWWLPA